eukprot:g34196.t1
MWMRSCQSKARVNIVLPLKREPASLVRERKNFRVYLAQNAPSKAPRASKSCETKGKDCSCVHPKLVSRLAVKTEVRCQLESRLRLRAEALWLFCVG